jgi:hypothetical protein
MTRVGIFRKNSSCIWTTNLLQRKRSGCFVLRSSGNAELSSWISCRTSEAHRQMYSNLLRLFANGWAKKCRTSWRTSWAHPHLVVASKTPCNTFFGLLSFQKSFLRILFRSFKRLKMLVNGSFSVAGTTGLIRSVWRIRTACVRAAECPLGLKDDSEGASWMPSEVQSILATKAVAKRLSAANCSSRQWPRVRAWTSGIHRCDGLKSAEENNRTF